MHLLRFHALDVCDLHQRLEVLDALVDEVGELRILLLQRVGEHDFPGDLDALDVLLHIDDGGRGIRRLPAARLLLADLVGEVGGALEQLLRCKAELLVADALLELVHVGEQVGDLLVEALRLLRRKQHNFDRVIAALGVGPGIDQLVEITEIGAGHRLHRLPALARGDPGLLRRLEVARLDRGLHLPGAGDRLADVLDDERLVRFDAFGHRRRLRRAGRCGDCRRDQGTARELKE